MIKTSFCTLFVVCKELLNSKKVVIIINIQKSKQVTMRGRIYGNDDSLSWWISGGGRAGDQIYNYVSDYMEGSLTREQFWVLAKFKYPTHQITFCTEEALKCLEYRGCEVIK